MRSAIAAKLAEGKLIVVDTLELKDAKTKLYRDALDKLNVTRTALLVENGKTLSRNLLLGARNIEGVELVLNNEVHPYDLLRYERSHLLDGCDRAVDGDAGEECVEAQARR